MWIIARLVRRVTGHVDNPRHNAPGPYPGLRDRHPHGAAQCLVSHQAVQPSPFAERQILRLAQRPGETGCPAAYISRDWVQSIRSLANPDQLGPARVILPAWRPLVAGEIAISATPNTAIPAALDLAGAHCAQALRDGK